MVDTGASRTVIHKPLLQEFAFKTLEQSPVQANTIFSTSETIQAEIPVFKIGRCKMENYIAVGIDLSAVTETYNQLGHPAINAIIGGDILLKYHAVINYDKKTLRLNKKA